MPGITCNYSRFPASLPSFNGTEELEFSVDELIYAAYTVGKRNWDEVHAHPYYSIKEIDFRISMIHAFLNLRSDTVTRSAIFRKLDPSEKGAINYFLGNVFCKLIMQRKFQVLWLLHLDLFEGTIDIGDQNKRPDFIGKQNNSDWIAVEAKGRQTKDNKVETDALKQLSYLKTIDGSSPTIKLATILHGKVDDNLQLEIIDPEKSENLKLKMDNIEYDYARDYYGIIYLLIKQGMNIQNIDGRDFATRTLRCHEAILGLDLNIYSILEETRETVYVTKKIEEYLKDNYGEDELSETTGYFIGPDGIYVKYIGEIKS